MREPSPGALDVSRETLTRLEQFADLVREWNPRINLVSEGTLPSLWTRHILDSAQLLRHSEDPSKWLDLGSGGGFPGIVVAILLKERMLSSEMTLVESDKRKSAFLKTAVRNLDLRVSVRAERIEAVTNVSASTLSARALAPLDRLLGYAQPRLAVGGIALFPKGRNWRNEVRIAEEKWLFSLDVVESETEAESALLKISGIQSKREDDR